MLPGYIRLRPCHIWVRGVCIAWIGPLSGAEGRSSPVGAALSPVLLIYSRGCDISIGSPPAPRTRAYSSWQPVGLFQGLYGGPMVLIHPLSCHSCHFKAPYGIMVAPWCPYRPSATPPRPTALYRPPPPVRAPYRRGGRRVPARGRVMPQRRSCTPPLAARAIPLCPCGAPAVPRRSPPAPACPVVLYRTGAGTPPTNASHRHGCVPEVKWAPQRCSYIPSLASRAISSPRVVFWWVRVAPVRALRTPRGGMVGHHIASVTMHVPPLPLLSMFGPIPIHHGRMAPPRGGG